MTTLYLFTTQAIVLYLHFYSAGFFVGTGVAFEGGEE